MDNSLLPQISLPTTDKLGYQPPEDDADAKAIAAAWFNSFTQAILLHDAAGVTGLILDDGFWRDLLALTWDFRTFQGAPRIGQFLRDVLPNAALGHGSGIFRLVPFPSGKWRACSVFTNLEDLRAFPEQIGRLRDAVPNHGQWIEKRRREVEFTDMEPAVIVIGAGQSGLGVAARLKHLGVPTLVVEKQARIGDQWRGRYDSLCLHDTVWSDHLPYIPFPPSWPVWTPAPKLADWLESYAHALELNVWTGATVKSIAEGDHRDAQAQNSQPSKGAWTVSIMRSDGTERTFKPRHIIFAVGWSGGVPKKPMYPGEDDFTGKIIHSSEHKSARDHIGKKVVIVGACNSGHDIAQDHYNHGVDVTLFQRSSTYIMSTKNGIPVLLGGLYSEGGPPTDVADRFNASFPIPFMAPMVKRLTKGIADADREILDGLQKRGFRLNLKEDLLQLFWKRGGGYYLDVGASQLIIDGKIKLKNDSQISKFTRDGILFENGSTVSADVVIFATGFGDPKDPVRALCGDKIADRVNPVWRLNNEGELNTVWRWSGVPGLYIVMGTLSMCRFYSKHLALQIKAIEEGIFGPRYMS